MKMDSVVEVLSSYIFLTFAMEKKMKTTAAYVRQNGIGCTLLDSLISPSHNGVREN